MKIFLRNAVLVSLQWFALFAAIRTIPIAVNYIRPELIDEILLKKISIICNSYNLQLATILLFISTFILLFKTDKENILLRKKNEINSSELDTKIEDLIKKQIHFRKEDIFNKVHKLEKATINKNIYLKKDGKNDNFKDCFNLFLSY